MNDNKTADFDNFVPKTKWPKYVMNLAHLTKSIMFHKFYVILMIFVTLWNFSREENGESSLMDCVAQVFCQNTPFLLELLELLW